MIKSMTGFGRSEIASGNRKIMVEMKSVNHRFLEASIKMPKKLNVFEARIRDVIKKYASRGKIDVFITYEDSSENNVNIKYNAAVAKEYMDIFRQMEEEFAIRNDITVGALSRYPEVITMEEAKEDEEELDTISVEQAKQYMDEGHFGIYNMLPKFQASVGFIEKKEGRSALITSFDTLKDALKGKTGTVIE